MENKRLLILASAILITLFLVVFISAKTDNKDLKDSFKNCTQKCELDKKTAHQNCISVHKTESTKIREDYKKCTKDLKNLKEADKNNTINKTDLNNKLKECTKTYLAGLKEADKKRKECFKNAKINCEKKCKEENKNKKEENVTKCAERPKICPTLYDPVCGWFNDSIKCFKYPCANKYSNSCVACSDKKVDYWTPGKCPDSLKNSK